MPKAKIGDCRIHYNIIDGCTIVRPEGPCDQVRTEALARLVDSSLADSKHLILDLSHSDYVETPGYRWIMRQLKKLQDQGKSLVITGMTPSTERIFKLLRLDESVPVARNVTEALEMVEGERQTVGAGR